MRVHDLSVRLCVGSVSALLVSVVSAQAPDVTFSIDTSSPSHVISPLIYGANYGLQPDGVGSLRHGGNRWTGYNWETNHSNAGADWFHHSDTYLLRNTNETGPAAAVMPRLNEAAGLGAAAIVTLPIAGYVSADANGTVSESQAAPSSRWHEVRAKKSSVYNTPLSLSPNKNDGYVFNDEFVNFIEANKPAGLDVHYTLDNEPGLWDHTHERLFGASNVTFAQLTSKTIEHATVVKDVAPNAKVLGGVTFGYSAQRDLHGASDYEQLVPQSERNADPGGLFFNRHLLREVKKEEDRQGRTLMDVLDVHFYSEARGNDVRVTGTDSSPAVAAARMQSTRSLWDPTYVETSWLTQWVTRGDSLNMLNRIQDDIDELKPGTLISISEYNFGGSNHISGAIAQADALGIFGREGLYNANRWSLVGDTSEEAFAKAGFEVFTNFDGEGGRFGEMSLMAETDDIEGSAIYASRSEDNPDELILVAINRSGETLDALIDLEGDTAFSLAEVFRLTGDDAEIDFWGELALGGVNAFNYEMPAHSVSTLRLTAVPEPTTLWVLLVSIGCLCRRRPRLS